MTGPIAILPLREVFGLWKQIILGLAALYAFLMAAQWLLMNRRNDYELDPTDKGDSRERE